MELFDKDYGTYNASDFINDDAYKYWIRYGVEKTPGYWQAVKLAWPQKADEMEQAANLILVLSTQVSSPHEAGRQRVWNNIRNGMQQVAPHRTLPKMRYKYRRYAAVLLLGVLLSAGGWYYWYTRPLIFHTGYGQTQLVILPDQSAVILNANSTLHYHRRWHDGKRRELWLEGEAYLDVKHLNLHPEQISPGDEFVLHAGQVDIAVLGTIFNVKSRRGITTVSLKSGRVKVSNPFNQQQFVVMQPGELVTFRQQTAQLEKQVAAPELFNAWTEHKMALSNTTVNDILQSLEDTYGQKIIMEDTAMGNRRIDGIVPMRNMEDALFVISNILGTKTVKTDSAWVLKKK
ncbi:FecR family protein [Chitinophaga defluvii]|uniref:FecR domain-containing protein n=1 Tax=Chitinophaga defluvii TaxID=3163343 RepID=A0ABV2TEF1_9BACT